MALLNENFNVSMLMTLIVRCGDIYNSSICLFSCTTAESGYFVSETHYIACLFKAVLVFLIWRKKKDFHGVWTFLQYLLLLIEMSALSSTCDENSGANSFSYDATDPRGATCSHLQNLFVILI